MRPFNIYQIIFCFFLLLVVLFDSSHGFANEKMNVPEGIVYKEASDEINIKAEEKLRKALEGDSVSFQSLLPPEMETLSYVGTFLSSKLMSNVPKEILKILTCIKLNTPLSGLTIVSQNYAASATKQRKLLAELLSEHIKIGKNFKIRKLSREDMVVVWFFIGWDFDEPIFLVEDDNKKYVFDFDSTGQNLFWIDEISHPCIQLGQPGVGALTSCRCLVPNLENNKYDLSFVESCGDSADVAHAERK
ncbi:MAG: hypothetical protein H6858_10060 [Rhodospirillales bacterium]|nr:hypothetical protein [Alphaproteobacteria bacterium]MCB1839291.1 hypothetical protein [Alphaproteobacteria bacterium]MCB9977930.1 hypothetical protein [Rhodospirillales bacterium]